MASVPLAFPINSRDGIISAGVPLRDSFIANGYVEQVGDDLEVVKRPGYTLFSTPSVQGLGRGVYAFEGHVVNCVGSNIYVDNSLGGTTDSLTTRFTFTAVGASATSQKIAFFNSNQAYWIDLNSPSTVNSITLPGTGPYCPQIVSLDDYAFICEVPTSSIYQSGLNNLTTWAATDFIRGTVQPEPAVALARYLNYLILFKQYSMEFFRDAGNPAPGSVLSPVEGAALDIGCGLPYSVRRVESNLIWVGRTRPGRYQVYMLSGTTPQIISNSAVDRILGALCDQSSTILDGHYAYGLKSKGHVFYILGFPTAGFTLAYDLTTQFWHVWTSSIQVSLRPDTYFGCSDYCDVYPIGTIQQNAGLLQNYTTGVLYQLSESSFSDNGSPINFRVRTNWEDYGSMNRKFFNKLELMTNSGFSVIGIRYSADDFNSWSGYYGVPLSGRPRLYRLGASRKRAWEFLHTASEQARIKHVDLEIDVGTS